MELKDSIKEIIAELEKGGDVKAVFGEPIKEGNVIIVPVASLLTAGCGGGRLGAEKAEDDATGKTGKGFGLGVRRQARPVGYIKIANGEVKFEPIADAQKMLYATLAAFGLGAMALLKIMLVWKIKKMKRQHLSA